MNPMLNERIAPEVMQAIIAQATARGLSINDYLRDLLGLTGGQRQEMDTEELRRLVKEGVESGPGINCVVQFSAGLVPDDRDNSQILRI